MQILSATDVRSRGRRLLAGVLTGGALALAAAPAAPAGTYEVQTVDNGSTSGWTPSAEGAFNAAGAEAVQLSMHNGQGNAGHARWVFDAPEDTTVDAFTIWRNYSLEPGIAYGTPTWVLETHGAGTRYVNYVHNFGGSRISPGFSAESASGLSGQTRILAQVSCAGGGNCNAGSWGAVHAAYVAVRDDIGPEIASTSGSLLESGTLKGTETLAYRATDRGGGVWHAELQVDGVRKQDHVVDANGGACRPVSAPERRPCKLDASSSFSIDTTTLPEGERAVRLVVSDVAGNTTTYAKSVVVDNVPPPANTTAPSVVMSGGKPHVGRTIGGEPGTWTGSGITFTYRWQREVGASWESIPGATGPQYVPTSEDAGKRLRLRVTATNAEGAVDADSNQTPPMLVPGSTNCATGDFDSDGTSNCEDGDDDGDGTADAQDTEPFNPLVTKAIGGSAQPVGPSGSAGGSGGAGGAGGPGGPGGVGGAADRGALNGARATDQARLQAFIANTTKRIVRSRYGRPVAVTGRLLDAAGRPIVGAELHIHARPLVAGSQFALVAKAVTDADGRYRYLSPAGAGRVVRAAYRLHMNDVAYVRTADVEIQVTPRVRLATSRKALRNRQTVVFRGSIAGAPAGSRKVVELQAKTGRGWTTFATTRLSRGRFTHRYRFTRTYRATTYAFRARVRSEPSWPFAHGTSKTTKVRVRP